MPFQAMFIALIADMGLTVKNTYLLSLFLFAKPKKRGSGWRVTAFDGNALKNGVFEWEHSDPCGFGPQILRKSCAVKIQASSLPDP